MSNLEDGDDGVTDAFIAANDRIDKAKAQGATPEALSKLRAEVVRDDPRLKELFGLQVMLENNPAARVSGLTSVLMTAYDRFQEALAEDDSPGRYDALLDQEARVHPEIKVFLNLADAIKREADREDIVGLAEVYAERIVDPAAAAREDAACLAGAQKTMDRLKARGDGDDGIKKIIDRYEEGLGNASEGAPGIDPAPGG